jgi:signal transduction histidine kinase
LTVPSASASTLVPVRRLTVGLQVALLAAVAAAADWFAPPIFGRHTLVLGLVPYWLAVRLFGPTRALPILVVSGLSLWFKWNSAYSPALIALEGLWVGAFWGRRRNPLIADVLYWALIGTPLSFVFYTYAIPVPHPIFGQILVVQPINGFIAIWITYVALELLPVSRSQRADLPPQSFSRFLLKRYLAFGTLPLLVAGLLFARTAENHHMREASSNLESRARALGAGIGGEVARLSLAVQEIALRQTDAAWFHDADRLSGDLERVRRQSRGFVTLLAARDDGTVFAVASPDSHRVAAGSIPPVNDREYFAAPMATGRPHVSRAFRGRGFGSDLVVAVSAPAVSRSGAVLGIVEGSVRADNFAVLLAQSAASSGVILLCDAAHRVIASTSPAYPAFTSLAGTALGRRLAQPDGTASRFTVNRSQERGVSHLMVTVPVPGTDWTLSLQRPLSQVLQPVMQGYGWTIAVAIGTALVASAFAAGSIRDLLRGWRLLIGFSRSASMRPDLLEDTRRLRLPEEFHELADHLRRMADRVDSERTQREHLLARLEEIVHERTRQLEQALADAQSADRAKSAFLATVSHELRTPLTAIVTSVALMKKSAAQSAAPASPALAVLDRSSRILMAVISDVLDYSKLEAGMVSVDPRPFSPAEVVAEVVSVLKPNADVAGITLRGTPASGDALWDGDPTRIRQVLLNLVGNAVKFTSAGSVAVEAGICPATADLPRRLVFRVVDTGPGIPAELVDSIFEPFVQIGDGRVRSQAGTGLGLTISRKLVEMMGGRITVTSSPGQGSTFEFWVR